MYPKSIRWRLPITYAAIALLAAVALGVVLVMTLRSYYQDREAHYLRGNAQAISFIASRLLDKNAPTGALQARAEMFSFLSQTRVQLLDTNHQVMVDSGVPQPNNSLSILFRRSAGDGISSPAPNHPDGDYIWTVSRKMEALPLTGAPFDIQILNCGATTDDQPVEGCGAVQSEAGVPVGPPAGPPDQLYKVSVAPSLYGFGFGDDIRFDNRRSDQTFEIEVMNNQQQVIGYVRLSDGPAYGSEIVDGVVRGWWVASSIAVVLAATVGWLISRWMSAPLIHLTLVSSRMAKGDLSARANITQEDEFGALGQAFNNMAAKIEETVVVLRRFVADAAHEIHTPLTALHTNLELALTDEGNGKPFLERALGQVKRLEMLTDGLLQLSRLETTPLNEKPEAVNLVAVVHELSEFFASQAEQAGLSFNLELPKTPIMVNLNAAQFRSALSNLLDNAIKFTPENGTVTLRVVQEGYCVKLWVQDTGIGIPADDLPQMFNRFHRGRNASAYAGSGLGLAIVRAVMDRHRGQVTVNSSAQGTQFMLQLPIMADR